MAEILKGKPVAEDIRRKSREEVSRLKSHSISPAVAIIRLGERSDDIAYERNIIMHCNAISVDVKKYIFSSDITQDELITNIHMINDDSSIHGVLIFRPLPPQFDDNAVCRALSPEKDVDGITNGSLAGVFTDTKSGFAPCTAQACMEILDYYGIDPHGKNVTIVGRSLVVGKPVSMLLLKRHATVTICHTKTNNISSLCREAEILVVAAGRANIADKNYFSSGQIVIDVGINVDSSGSLCGDVNFDDAEKIVGSITPVPGGVGTVTTAVLVKHVIEAAEHTAGARCSKVIKGFV